MYQAACLQKQVAPFNTFRTYIGLFSKPAYLQAGAKVRAK